MFRKPGKYVNLKEEWVYEKIIKRWCFHLISHFEERLSHVIVNCEFIFWVLGGTFPLLIGLNFPYGVEPLCYEPLI